MLLARGCLCLMWRFGCVRGFMAGVCTCVGVCKRACLSGDMRVCLMCALPSRTCAHESMGMRACMRARATVLLDSMFPCQLLCRLCMWLVTCCCLPSCGCSCGYVVLCAFQAFGLT